MKDWEHILADARRLESPCNCCVHRCGVARHSGETGTCGATSIGKYTKFFITYGEEPQLTPSRMLYFSHCNMRCAYCTNMEYIQPEYNGGEECAHIQMAQEIDREYAEGHIKSFQILGGEPSCSLSTTLKVASHIASNVPIVWNSNFTFTQECLDILLRSVDFFVADLKFGNDKCARNLANFPEYWDTVTANLASIPKNKLLIRHLPLGGHLDCCSLPVIDFLKTNFPHVPVSFHTLLPDAAGKTRGLTPQEQCRLEDAIAKSRLNQCKSTLSHTEGTSARQYFPSEILIRKDGTVMVQDLTEQVRNLLEKLQV